MDKDIKKILEDLFDETMERERGYKKIETVERKKFKQTTLEAMEAEYEEKADRINELIEDGADRQELQEAFKSLTEAIESLDDFDDDLKSFADKSRIVEKK